jgi:hypothetical protein
VGPASLGRTGGSHRARRQRIAHHDHEVVHGWENLAGRFAIRQVSRIPDVKNQVNTL